MKYQTLQVMEKYTVTYGKCTVSYESLRGDFHFHRVDLEITCFKEWFLDPL